MKTSVLASAFALATLAAAQLDQLPSCALPCALTSLPSECNATDYACICGQEDWITSITTCLQTACSPEDLTTAATAAQGICSSAGVTLPSSLLTATATGSPSASTGTANATASVSTTPTGTSAADSTETPGAAVRAAAPGLFAAAVAGVAVFVL